MMTAKLGRKATQLVAAANRGPRTFQNIRRRIAAAVGNYHHRHRQLPHVHIDECRVPHHARHETATYCTARPVKIYAQSFSNTRPETSSVVSELSSHSRIRS